MTEIWKSLDGIVEKGTNYEVSNLGRVRHSRKGNMLSITKSQRYAQVGLCEGGKLKKYLVHRLVALAFLPNPDNKPQVNHLDGNKLNNELSNLEWTTVSENIIHAIDTGLNPVNTLITAEDVIKIKTAAVNGMSQREIVYNFDYTADTINDVLKGKRWKHVEVDGFVPLPHKEINSAKISADDVKTIRTLHETGKYNHRQLAEMYNVGRRNITQIINRVTWKHVV